MRVFMDFDGRAQPGPDLDTRGMLVTAADGTVTRYFTDVYPLLTGAAPGAASVTTVIPTVAAVGSGLPTTSRAPRGPWVVLLLLGVGAVTLASRRRRWTRSRPPRGTRD